MLNRKDIVIEVLLVEDTIAVTFWRIQYHMNWILLKKKRNILGVNLFLLDCTEALLRMMMMMNGLEYLQDR